MLAGLRDRWLLLGLIFGHLLVASGVECGYGEPSLSTFKYAHCAARLVVLGADIALVAVWTALAPYRRNMRLVVTILCVLCWCVVYDVWPFTIRAWRFGWLDRTDWSYYFVYSRLETLASLPVLVVLGVAGALAGLVRRGTRLERLDRDELDSEAGVRQFQVSHLLLLVSLVSLLLSLSVHFHAGPSRQISMRWNRPDNAPIYSAETALLSSLFLVALALALVWATLSMGGPSLRLLLVLGAAELMGVGWAYAFTAPNHAHFLWHNARFSGIVAFGQALVISGVLLLVRRRGYRLIRRPHAVAPGSPTR